MRPLRATLSRPVLPDSFDRAFWRFLYWNTTVAMAFAAVFVWLPIAPSTPLYIRLACTAAAVSWFMRRKSHRGKFFSEEPPQG